MVLQDTPSEAGLRLVIPSLATPVGGLIAGFVMSRWGQLSTLVRIGCSTMTLGNGLMALLSQSSAKWKYIVYLFPANLGQGIVYPSILFTFLAANDHSGTSIKSSLTTRTSRVPELTFIRASCSDINSVLNTISWYGVGCRCNFYNCAECPSPTSLGCPPRYTSQGQGKLLSIFPVDLLSDSK